MGQISVEIMRLPGSLLGGNQQHKSFCVEHYPKCGFEHLISEKKSTGLLPGRYRTQGNRVFGVTHSYGAYIEVPGFFGSKSYSFSSIEKMMEAGSLTADEVRTARKIS